MSKRIAFCADGTWDGGAHRTNVYRMFQAIASDSAQVAIYDDGVDMDGSPIEKLPAGVFGTALFQKIKDGYTKIAHAYEAGDELFLFGFSRGAFTARSIAGMIAVCGLPTANFTDDMVDQAFQAYRERFHRSENLAGLAALYDLFDAKIAMIGVWDTVGSLGIPAISGAVDPIICGFLDTALHPDVQNAYHALAIDERRMEFPPTLWTESSGQTVEQVWFAGAHADVGGGYPADSDGTALSDITLSWMITRALALGLEIHPVAQNRLAPPLDPVYAFSEIHESWSELWGNSRPRSIGFQAAVSDSVAIRCRYDPSYRPVNLTLINGELPSSYQLVPTTGQDPQAVARAQQIKAGKDVADDPASVKFRLTYPAFEGDLVSFGQQSFQEPLNDSLGSDIYAGHLAQLIVAYKTPLPLSLGLFGDWGSGKSYFMRLLHRQIDTLAARTDGVFCRKVVQIHFNAWHYLDTNLWASLVSEIFDNLFTSLTDRPDTPNKKVEALKKRLADESALAAEARRALADAKTVREDAERRLREATQKRKESEATVGAFIDDLAHVVTDAGLKDQLNDIATEFGISRLSESFSELEARALEARSLAGRIRTLGLTLLSPEGRFRRLALLVAALLTPVVLARVVPLLFRIKDAELAAFVRSLTAIVALVGAVASWISAQTKRGTALVGRLEAVYARVKSSREEARKDPDAITNQRQLDRRISDEADAGHVLSEAQARVRAIESELYDLAPGRRLFQFLEQRSAAKDYRQHLGLVSLVRHDFERLSGLLREGREFHEGGEPMLDRIVLYVDDLDRCKSDRVIAVLEAVHLLLAFPIFAVVVAVDPRWLRRSLLEEYPTLLSGGQMVNLERIGNNGEGLASPQDYLEKIFQVPFQLQRMEEKGFSSLVTRLLPAALAKSAPVPDTAVETAKQEVGAIIATPQAAVPPGFNTPAPPPTVEPLSVVPERLQLERWEQEAVKQCHPLFRTPRAVKRLANTYCLIRVGVEAVEWRQFLGSATSHNAEYRTPLLMLAVAAAYPGLASRWFDSLETNGRWIPVGDSHASPDGNRTDITSKEWDEFTAALKSMKAGEFAVFEVGRVRKWIPRIRRYSF